MVITGAQIIQRALQGIRVLGHGRPLHDRMASLALPYLQEIIDSWKIERLAIYTVVWQSFTLVANQATRTIGPSGQFVYTPVPRFLADAAAIPVGQTVESAVDVWDRDEYLRYPDKVQTDLLPRAVYMEPGAVNNTLNFIPVPTTAATLKLGIPTGVTGFADLSTEYTFPEGYHEAFRTELEYRVSDPFGKGWTAKQEDARKKAFGRIQRQNDQGPPILSSDPAVSGWGFYDIDRDQNL